MVQLHASEREPKSFQAIQAKDSADRVTDDRAGSLGRCKRFLNRRQQEQNRHYLDAMGVPALSVIQSGVASMMLAFANTHRFRCRVSAVSGLR